MSVSRFHVGKDGKSPYERQRGRKCDLQVVPFGEVVLFRLPEVANYRHQALEEKVEPGDLARSRQGHRRDPRCWCPWSEKGVGNKEIA